MKKKEKELDYKEGDKEIGVDIVISSKDICVNDVFDKIAEMCEDNGWTFGGDIKNISIAQKSPS